MSNFKKVVREVETERKRQDQMWGGPKHDDGHTASEWLHFIKNQLHDAKATDYPERYRMGLVKIAALAIAAAQAYDRRQDEDDDAP